MATQLTAANAGGAQVAPIRLLNTNEAAAALGVGRRTVQEKVAARELGCVRIGRAIRFHPDDIAAFIDNNRDRARGWKGGGRA